MKGNIPRQLTAVIAISAAVTLLAAGVLVTTLRQALTDSTAIATEQATGLIRSYSLLETVDSTRADVQRALRERDPDVLEKIVERLEANRKQTAALLDEAGSEGAAIKTQVDAVTETERQILDAVLRGDLAAGSELFIERASPQYETLQGEIRKFAEAARAAGAAKLQDSQAAQWRSVVWRLAFVCVLLVAFVSYQWYVKRNLTRQLLNVANTLWQSSASLTSASSQVAATSQSVSQGATEQAASLEETSAALEEMAGMTRQSAQSAEHAMSLARDTRAAAEHGTADMEALGTAMDEIRSSSDNVAKILKTINEIAFQTNILALNAAVEAARAGEAGMGFAVVADEVRTLAQRSAQAAQDTAAKIEDSLVKSKRGLELRDKVGAGLKEILDKARVVDGLMSEIASAAQQQRQGIEQVSTAVADMEKVTQAGAAGAEEGAAAAEELNGLAIDVEKLVQQLQQLVGVKASGTASAPATTQPDADQKPSQALRRVA